MGRKSIDKLRKSQQDKIEHWMLALLPKLQSYSPQKITMDELAALIGKRKSTIYEYFSSKEEVLLSAVLCRIKQLQHYKMVIDLEADDVHTTYTTLMELMCKGVEDISIVFLNDLEEHFPDVWKEVVSFLNGVLEDVALIYQKGMKNGHFREVPTPLLLSLDNFFVSRMITNKAFFTENNITLDQLVREYLALRLNGLSSTV